MNETTPGPWEGVGLIVYGSDDTRVATVEPRSWAATSGIAKANAAFIVKAVNSHERTLDALREFVWALDRSDEAYQYVTSELRAAGDIARAAIEAAS